MHGAEVPDVDELGRVGVGRVELDEAVVRPRRIERDDGAGAAAP